MHTTIETWRHPSGRVVTLIGTIHIGHQSYYDRIGVVVGDLERRGAAVHHEGIQQPPPDTAMTPDEAAAVAKLHTAPAYAWLADLLGLTVQRIPGHHDGWVNTDLDALTFLRALPNRDRLLRLFDDVDRLQTDLNDASAPPWATTFLRRAARVMTSPMGRRLLRITRRRDPNEAVILGMRNTMALAALDDTTGDVVAIWGAGHLPGIGHGLSQRGYTRTDRQQITAHGGSTRALVETPV